MHNLLKNACLLGASTLIALLPFQAEAALLVASRASNSILRYDDKTGEFIDAFIPAGSGGLDGPTSLVFGPNDNYLYVSSYYNSSVLRYDRQTGAFVDVFIPSGSGGLVSPESIQFGPDNNLYIVGLDGSGLRRYNGTTGEFIDVVVGFDPPGDDVLSSPDFAFTEGNDIFMSSVLPSNGILRYDAATGVASNFVLQENAPGVPGGMTIGREGNLYVGDFSPVGSIRRYNPQTGAFIDFFVPPGTGGLSQASRLRYGPDNNLYVTSFGSDSVLRFDSRTGAFIDAFVPSGSGGIDDPIGLLFTDDDVSASVAEPHSYLGLLGFGVSLAIGLFKRKQQQA